METQDTAFSYLKRNPRWHQRLEKPCKAASSLNKKKGGGRGVRDTCREKRRSWSPWNRNTDPGRKVKSQRGKGPQGKAATRSWTQSELRRCWWWEREGTNQVRSAVDWQKSWPREDLGHLRWDSSFIHLSFIQSVNVYAMSIHWGSWPRGGPRRSRLRSQRISGKKGVLISMKFSCKVQQEADGQRPDGTKGWIQSQCLREVLGTAGADTRWEGAREITGKLGINWVGSPLYSRSSLLTDLPPGWYLPVK